MIVLNMKGVLRPSQRLLYVEENGTLAEQLIDGLNAAGYAAEWASDGYEALARIAGTPMLFDVLILGRAFLKNRDFAARLGDLNFGGLVFVCHFRRQDDSRKTLWRFHLQRKIGGSQQRRPDKQHGFLRLVFRDLGPATNVAEK